MGLKINAVFLFLLISFYANAQKKDVSFKVTYKAPYCGGARPSKEAEEAAQIARPYILKRLVLINESGKSKCVKTDREGNLNLKLNPGKYKLFEEWRYKKKIPAGHSSKEMDGICLKTEWNKHLLSITVLSDKTEILLVNEIIVYCPWALPCLLESAQPPMPQ